MILRYTNAGGVYDVVRDTLIKGEVKFTAHDARATLPEVGAKL